MRPECLPSWTACVRRRAPSFSNRRLECVLTVFSLTKIRSAISLLLRPSGDQAKDLELALGHSEGLAPRRVRRKHDRFGGNPHLDFLHHNPFTTAGERQPEPDPERGEHEGDQPP